MHLNYHFFLSSFVLFSVTVVFPFASHTLLLIFVRERIYVCSGRSFSFSFHLDKCAITLFSFCYYPRSFIHSVCFYFLLRLCCLFHSDHCLGGLFFFRPPSLSYAISICKHVHACCLHNKCVCVCLHACDYLFVRCTAIQSMGKKSSFFFPQRCDRIFQSIRLHGHHS